MSKGDLIFDEGKSTREVNLDKANLGCGNDYRDGWLNVDVDPDTRSDVVYDLAETPWPWPDGAFDLVLLDNVYEHIPVADRPAVLKELHRVLSSTGKLTMRLPVPEIGVGWDATHQPIPSWRWPLHPQWRDKWRLEEISASRVGPGRIVPESVARALTRFWVARCIDEVTIVVRPR